MTDDAKRKVRFDYGFKVGSELEMLVDYLNNLDNLLFRDVVMQSARSYWMPLALKQAGVTGTELEVAGNNAVMDLIRQAKEICLTLGIDSTQFAGLFGGSPAPMPTYWGAMPGGGNFSGCSAVAEWGGIIIMLR